MGRSSKDIFPNVFRPILQPSPDPLVELYLPLSPCHLAHSKKKRGQTTCTGSGTIKRVRLRWWCLTPSSFYPYDTLHTCNWIKCAGLILGLPLSPCPLVTLSPKWCSPCHLVPSRVSLALRVPMPTCQHANSPPTFSSLLHYCNAV
jgi:hypothetical protein